MLKKTTWTSNQVEQLHDLIIKGYKYEEIASTMKRSFNSVYCKALKLGYHKESKYFNTKSFKQHIKPYGYERTIHWRQHPKYKNYYVSDTGLIWSALRGRELKRYRLVSKSSSKKGLWVSITREGRPGHQTKVSRLVAQAFLNLTPNQVVIHRDRNVENNDISNLLVLSKSDAGKATAHLAKAWPIGKFNNKGFLIERFKSVRSAAEHEDISYQTLLDHLNGKTKNNKYSQYKKIYKKKRREN